MYCARRGASKSITSRVGVWVWVWVWCGGCGGVRMWGGVVCVGGGGEVGSVGGEKGERGGTWSRWDHCTKSLCSWSAAWCWVWLRTSTHAIVLVALGESGDVLDVQPPASGTIVHNTRTRVAQSRPRDRSQQTTYLTVIPGIPQCGDARSSCIICVLQTTDQRHFGATDGLGQRHCCHSNGIVWTTVSHNQTPMK